MNREIIQKVSDVIMRTIGRPFTHNELQRDLEEIVRFDLNHPLPHLTQAVAFGLGHRDLSALAQHTLSAGRLLDNLSEEPFTPEMAFYHKVYSVLMEEGRLVRLQLDQPRDKKLVLMKPKDWSREKATIGAALEQLDVLVRPLWEFPLFRVIVPALQALSIATSTNSSSFQNALKALKEQFAARNELHELAGYFLMYCHLKLRAWDEACQVGETIIRYNPRCLIAHTTLGSMYYYAGRYAEAHASYKAGVTLMPSNAQVRLAYAKVSWRIGLNDEAEAALNEAQHLDSTRHLTSAMHEIRGLLTIARKNGLKPLKRVVG
jgi:tetratricopeptide (TPR) repeat protein